jgi:hypothetical protein
VQALWNRMKYIYVVMAAAAAAAARQ